MKHLFYVKGLVLSLAMLISFIPFAAYAQGGKIFQRVNSFKQNGSFSKETAVFLLNSGTSNFGEVYKSVKQFTLLNILSVSDILKTKPAFLNIVIPVNNGNRSIRILLYKESISQNGFTLLTNSGRIINSDEIINYRGSIDNDENSVAAFTFSPNEISGLINNSEGNFVVGKIQHSNTHIIYNDKDVISKPLLDCGTNTAIPLSPGNYFRGTESTTSVTTKCVNWYWETDYDIFTNKGSIAGVNSFIQGIFNQVSTLYANDGISINLKTLFVWTATDPYTGPGTSNYLDQFGVNRTSFDGDLASLIGFNGGGGIAWINGLCNSQTKYKMSYCGISSGYNTVPSYSWTVECITHEEGHLLGSRHTHDCVWNGNNTKIDGCGDNAGYPSGTCANPGNPAGGGTIMSYCHLTNVGINFNLGFGPQPKALMINNVNNAACLTSCNTGCTVPNQPTAINGNTSVCSGTSQTYSIAAVAGATSYTWTLPSGSGGASTTNTITVTIGGVSGNISVTASNTCGTGTACTLAVNILSSPAQPGTISGNTTVCSSTSQIYSIAAVAGATSYTWTLPSGWSGSSTTNSITATSGGTGGNITVKANNSCGSGITRTLAVTITASAPAQPAVITGPSTVCPGSVQTYSVPVVAGATSYNWTLPAGWSGASTTNSISVTAGGAGGNINVTASNGCGTSVVRIKAVATNGAVPASPGTIVVSGGSANVCIGDNRTYTVSLVSGVTYNWIAPAGATITGGQGTNSINLLFTASFTSPGTLSVSASNSCGAGPSSAFTISKNIITKPGAIAVSGGSVKVCPGDTRTYSVPSVAGITYNWTVPVGAVLNSGQGTSAISASYTANFTTSGTLKVTANNQCGTSNARVLTVSRNLPPIPATISGEDTVCAGLIETYLATPVAVATSYSWTLPAGATAQGAVNGNSINIHWGIKGGTITVRAINACGISGSRSFKVFVGCSGGMPEFVQKEKNSILHSEVYPNPTTDITNIEFYSESTSLYTLSVSDMTGRKLMHEKQQAVKGVNFHTFNLAKLTKGTYLISIESNDYKKVLKVNVL